MINIDMTQKFDKYVNDILLEMPVINGRHYPTIRDSVNGNKYLFDKEIKSPENVEIGDFKNYKVYTYNSSNEHHDNFIFLDVVNEIYAASVTIHKMTINNQTSYITNSIWKYKLADQDLMVDIFFNFILERYPYIQSMSMHTIEAKNMWKNKIIPSAFSNNYKISLIDLSNMTEEFLSDLTSFNNVEDSVWRNAQVVPRIYAK